MTIGIGGDGSGYWMKLMDYIHMRGEFQAFLCTSEEMLREELVRKKAEVLFLQDGFAAAECQEIPVVPFSAQRGRKGSIYQYQSADCIYRQMRQFVQNRTIFGEKKGVEVYVVYSPLGRSGKTSFALAYARKHSFFYIGMEEYGIRGKDSRGMEEILYHIRNRKEGITKIMSSIAEERDGVRMIASPVFFSDVRMLEAEDFRWFLEQIRADENQESVFIDLGTGCLVDFEVLDYFNKVYITTLPEEQEKMDRFMELLLEVNGEMKGKLNKIHVPKGAWHKEDFLEGVKYLDGIEYR